MRKRNVFCSICLICLTFFTGCGSSLPEMSDIQQREVVEYAARVLMRHMNDYDSRLVDLSLYSEPEEEKETPQKPMDPTVDKETIDNTVTGGTLSIEELLLPEGLTLTYKGYQVDDSYADGTPYFSLDAEKGNKFVILSFEIHNTTSTTVKVNLFDNPCSWTVKLNDKVDADVHSTLLLDDLTTYIGDIKSGDRISLFLLTEVKAEDTENVNNIRLTIRTNDGKATKLLQ